MPPVKVTWKTSIAEAKAHAAKMDAAIEAMNQANSATPVPTATPSELPVPGTPPRNSDIAQLAARWKSAQQQYGEYHPMGYQFVRECLRHTVEMVHGSRELDERDPATLANPDPSRHISAQQLCYGLKDLASERYGLLARTVLNRWGIRATRDIGNIVFAMLAVGILGRSDNDALEQFENVFDFAEEFALPG